MSDSEHSFSRRLLRGIPIPVIALIFGLLTGLLTSVVVDRFQTEALSEIFDQALDNQLDQQARESLIRFDEYRRSFTFLARLLANHRRMADYLDPILWPDPVESVTVYQDQPPIWLPREEIWQGGLKPSHILLVDPSGDVQEIYQMAGRLLPATLADDPAMYLKASEHRAYLTTFDEQPYLIVSQPIEDNGRYKMGSIVILVSLDHHFLVASQQVVKSSSNIIAIIAADGQHVLSSSDPVRVEHGASLDDLDMEYVVTAQSFFNYDDSDLNMLFATLLPRAVFEQTGRQVLELERQQRLMGAGMIILVFVLLFVFLSSRISRLLKRVSHFSHRALDIKQDKLDSGNQLLILEDWIRDFIQLVRLARDETRQRHESQIRETEKLRAAVMDTSLDSVATISQTAEIIDFNATAQATFGYLHDEVMGKPLAELIFYQGSKDDFEHHLYTCLARPDWEFEPQHTELNAVNKEGRVFPVEVAIKPVLLEEHLLFTVYVRDITERRTQESEIRAMAAFPRESPIPMLRVNRRGVITYANAPSTPLLDYWGCLPLQTLPVYWRNQVEEVLNQGQTVEMEVNIDDGVFSMMLAPVAEFDYVNIYARDITKVRRVEEESKQRQNELVHVSRLSTMGEMATGIAHELNQPLSAIVNFANGCARRLRLDIGGKDDLLNALEQISVQARRAGEIIKRLRGMVSRQAPVREVVDLNALILEVCSLMTHDIRRQEVAIERSLSSVPLMVRVDPVQIEQALLNLIRNALDSLASLLPLQRRLVLSSGHKPDGVVYVSVKDNGSGIEGKEMERLFDAFYTTKQTGMGMGLAITQTIVEDHHGRIHADSWPGQGSTFTIELPASSEPIESVTI